jgi:hypothetical protein
MLLEMRSRLPALLGMGALLLLAAVVARGASAVPVGETKPLFGWLRIPMIQPVAPEGRPAGVRPGEGWWAGFIGWFVILLPFMLLGLAIVAALLMSLRWRKLGVPTPVRNGEETGLGRINEVPALVHAARKARLVLDEHEGGPVSDAVIAVWLELERVAEHSGQKRYAHQTPTEFTDGIAGRYEEVQAALDDLRRLYQRARFGPPGSVTRADAAAARRALDEIVLGLTGELAIQ